MRKTAKSLFVTVASMLLAVSALVGCDGNGSSAAAPSSAPDSEPASSILPSSEPDSSSEAPVVVTGIEVTKLPTKVEYYINDAFDATGLEVSKVLSDNTKEVLGNSDYALSNPDLSTVGDKDVNVTYQTFSTKFVVKVLGEWVTSIEIASQPTKLSYNVGEQANPAGVSIKVNHFDGTSETLQTGFEFNLDTAHAGVKKAEVVYEGKSAFTDPINVLGGYTLNDYTAVSPSNWNELTYQDSNDTQIMSYIGGSFFSFNYDFDANGKIKEDGSFQVQYDAVSELEDVTLDYAGDEKYAVPADAEKGYAYKFTLRDDLRWDDGSYITAKDYVYTMKEQENPLFYNYRADSFYNGATVIHNAQNYLKQGSKGIFASKTVFGSYSADIDDQLIFDSYYADGASDDESSYILNWFAGDYPSYVNYIKNYGVFILLYLFEDGYAPADMIAASAAMDGKTLAEIKADADLKALWDTIIGWWQTEPDEELDFFITDYEFPAVDFNDVGIFVGDNENELVVVLDKTLNLFKEDGVTLSYKAAYNFAGLPLVKEDLYEANKVAPQTEGGLWTSKYNSSVATSASWGPYKLTSFQAGKQYVLERNPFWYGYNMPEYAGQYQTERIICETIEEWNSAWLLFQRGDISSIGIDVSIAADYKNSSRAVFTADDYVGSMQLQSDVEALAARSHTADQPNNNKIIMAYQDFRQAISLCIDRVAYTQKCTTASLPGFGLFNSMHYYDVENAGVYRNEDVAKKAICATYGVDIEDYDSLDAAYAAVTGYDLELARELLTNAYNQAIADGKMTAEETVIFTVGASADTESVRRQFDFLKEAFETLAVGTPLEGKLTLELNTSFGSTWANDFRAGNYDICTGGWSGAAWDPGYFLLAYLSPSYMYSQKWDTEKAMLKYNPYQDGNPDHEYEMSLMSWYNCLNGKAGAPFNWSEGEVENEFRLGIIAQLETEILRVYYTVPMYNYYSAQLRSYKIEYGSNVYNTFMGYGGIRYITYNYNDAEWAAVKLGFDYKN